MAYILTTSDGVRHLRGCPFLMYTTVCGDCDKEGEETYEASEGTPDCVGCIAGAQHVFDIATAKEIKGWKIR